MFYSCVTENRDVNSLSDLLGYKADITLWGILLKAFVRSNLTDRVIFLKLTHIHHIFEYSYMCPGVML